MYEISLNDVWDIITWGPPWKDGKMAPSWQLKIEHFRWHSHRVLQLSVGWKQVGNRTLSSFMYVGGEWEATSWDQRCLCWCTSKMLVHKLLHTHQKCRDEPFPLKTKFSSSFVPIIRAKVSSRVEQENSLLTCLHRRQLRSHFKKIKDTCAYVTYQPACALWWTVFCTSKVHMHLHGSGAYIKSTVWAISFEGKIQFLPCK